MSHKRIAIQNRFDKKWKIFVIELLGIESVYYPSLLQTIYSSATETFINNKTFFAL